MSVNVHPVVNHSIVEAGRKYATAWLFSTNTSTCVRFILSAAFKYAYIYIFIMEPLLVHDATAAVLRLQNTRIRTSHKSGHLLCGGSESWISGCFFFFFLGGGGSWLRTGVSGARICNHSVCSWLMPLILSAGITQYLSCDLPAPDWGNQGAAEQQADVTAVRAHRVKLPGWHTAQV